MHAHLPVARRPDACSFRAFNCESNRRTQRRFIQSSGWTAGQSRIPLGCLFPVKGTKANDSAAAAWCKGCICNDLQYPLRENERPCTPRVAVGNSPPANETSDRSSPPLRPSCPLARKQCRQHNRPWRRTPMPKHRARPAATQQNNLSEQTTVCTLVL